MHRTALAFVYDHSRVKTKQRSREDHSGILFEVEADFSYWTHK